ncbi:MAG: hypothetical protein C0601_08680 [Candidatus Muiribacterium halophilum]|uniref:Radical SAM core domain-containing protein n=1 Tax=Muiribacterium halophilum TaxID=2053465 RepID=A0A2N5ZEB9_MUIH1|nr:MAG: hypothetical protein C0601_08680 [Candidatus Muirbacterium halophilum]
MKIVCFYEAYESLAFERFFSIFKKYYIDHDLVMDRGIFSDYSIINPFFSKKIDSLVKMISDDILKKEPTHVMFSVFTDNLIKIQKIAELIRSKNKNIQIIAGGPHSTTMYRKMLNTGLFDIVVRGAGEDFIRCLCNNRPLDGKGACYIKENNIVENEFSLVPEEEFVDLKEDKDLFLKNMPWNREYIHTISSFGCYFKCSYCYHSVFQKPCKVIRKNIDVFIDQLLSLKKQGFKKVVFHDDLFISDRDHIIRFLTEYKKKIALPFMCIVYPAFLDKKICRLLKEAGCVNVEIGSQVLSDRLRKKYLQRSDKSSQVINAMRLLHRYNLSFTVDHIFGIPEETLKIHERSILEYIKYRPSRIHFCYMTIYPASKINNILLDKGLIDQKKIDLCESGIVDNVNMGGSVKVNEDLKRLEIIGHLAGIFSENLIRRLIRHRVYRILPSKLALLSKYFSYSIIALIKGNEFNIELQLKRYLSSLMKMLTMLLK